MGTNHVGGQRFLQFVSVGALFAGLWLPLVARGLTFQFNYVDSPTGTFASRGWLNPQSLFQQNIRAAGELWASGFESPATIVVRVDTTSYAARAGGGFSFGRFLHATAEGKQVWETGPLTRILTGDNPGENFFGYDVVLGFDASFVENFYWFDPNPQSRSAPVPFNRGDFLSVVLHEPGASQSILLFRPIGLGGVWERRTAHP